MKTPAFGKAKPSVVNKVVPGVKIRTAGTQPMPKVSIMSGNVKVSKPAGISQGGRSSSRSR